MSIANFAAAAGVPILGQTFKILVNYPTVIIQCQCDAKTVLPLIGVQNVSRCPACQNAYMIAGDKGQEVGQVQLRPPVTEAVQ